MFHLLLNVWLPWAAGCSWGVQTSQVTGEPTLWLGAHMAQWLLGSVSCQLPGWHACPSVAKSREVDMGLSPFHGPIGPTHSGTGALQVCCSLCIRMHGVPGLGRARGCPHQITHQVHQGAGGCCCGLPWVTSGCGHPVPALSMLTPKRIMVSRQDWKGNAGEGVWEPGDPELIWGSWGTVCEPRLWAPAHAPLPYWSSSPNNNPVTKLLWISR